MSKPSQKSDEQLVRQVLAGDRNAYGELAERYLQITRALANAYLRNHADAEDLTQDTLIRAYRSLDTLREPRAFGPWLATMTRRAAIDQIRNEKRRRALLEHAPKPSANNDPAVEISERRALVREQIMLLESGSREIVLLYYFAGKPIKEIASLLGLSSLAVQKRLSRARKAIGDQLLESLGETTAEAVPPRKRLERVLTGIALAAPSWSSKKAATGFSIGALPWWTAGGALPIVAMVLAAAFYWKPEPSKGAHAATPSPAVIETAAEQPAQTTRSAVPAPPESPVARIAVTGTVVDGFGQPLAGAKVMPQRIQPNASGEETPETRGTSVEVDERGHFVVDALEPGTYVWRILAPQSHVFFDEEFARTNILLDETPAPLRLVCDPQAAPRVTGNVVDADGLPVAGASISTRGSLQETVTDDDGRFLIGRLGRDRVNVTALKAGMGEAFAPNVWADGDDIQLTLHGLGAVSGRVVDAKTGAPISDFQIACTEQGSEEYAESGGRLHAVSNALGAFHIENAPAPAAGIVVEAPGYARRILPFVAVNHGETTSDITIELAHGVSIHGAVLTPENEPLSDASIVLGIVTDRRPDRIRAVEAARTDDEGRFELSNVPATERRISVVHRDYPAGTVIDIDPDATGGHIIRMARPAQLEGVVSWAETPLPNVRLTILYDEPEGQTSKSAETDERGRYTLKAVPPGPGNLRISMTIGPGSLYQFHRFVPVAIHEGRATVADIAIPAVSGVVSGSVSYNGYVPEGIGVGVETLEGSGCRQLQAVPVDADGAYRIENVPPGALRFRLYRLIDSNSVGMWPLMTADTMNENGNVIRGFSFSGDNPNTTEGFWQAAVAAWPAEPSAD